MGAIQVRRLVDFADPTILALSGDTSIAPEHRYTVRISAGTTYTVTVPAEQSHTIVNDGSVAQTVATTGNANTTLPAGQELRVAWDAETAAHVLDLRELTDDQITVPNLAAVRALTQTYDTVQVQGHTNAHDGGGGVFYRAGSGANSADIDAGGDDDDGWHVVTAGGIIYVRHDHVITPLQFGALPAATVTDADSATDLQPTMQRMFDFWANPTSVAGWSFRATNARLSLPCKVPDGFYACDSPVTIHVQDTVTSQYQDNWIPGDIEMTGRIFVPGSVTERAIILRGHRQAGMPRMHLRVLKGLTSGSYTWDSLDWPHLYEETETYRGWSASLAVYKNEYITATHGDGSKWVYECTETDTLGSSAPTHTTGTQANGNVNLKVHGKYVNAAGETIRSLIKKNWDWGVHVTDLGDAHDITVEAEGFSVGLMLCPRLDAASASWVGWNHFALGRNHGCMIGVMAVRYTAEFRVADEAARLALTGLQIGTRVHQDDNGTQYLFDGPAGGESDANNWTASANLNEEWVNDNQVQCGLTLPQQQTAKIANSRSVFGAVTDSWGLGTATGGPSGNSFNDLSVEFAAIDDPAKLYQAFWHRGSTNTVRARNDSAAIGAGFGASSYDDWDKNPIRNRAEIINGGRFIEAAGWRLERNNTALNVQTEWPMLDLATAHFSVPSLTDRACWSGNSEIGFRGLSLWDSQALTPAFYQVYDPTGPLAYNADTDSWNFDHRYPPALVVDLTENVTGTAVIAVEFFLAAGGDHRLEAFALNAGGSPLDTETAWTASPIGGHRQVFQTTSSSITRHFIGANSTNTTWLVAARWMPKIALRLRGNKVKGFQVTVYNLRSGRIYSPWHDGQQQTEGHANVIKAAPEHGIFRVPAHLTYQTPQSGNHRTFLNKPADGNLYYATSGQTSALSPGATDFWWGHDAAAQGSAVISQWDGAAWQQIATGAHYAEPADWLDY